MGNMRGIEEISVVIPSRTGTTHMGLVGGALANGTAFRACAANEISVSNTCYPIAGVGGPCVNSAQCQLSNAYCRNGLCASNIQYDNRESLQVYTCSAICKRPNQQVERESGVVKNCMYHPCSVGFGCEYSNAMGQYICCGNYDANNDYSYGKVRMYPGTTSPLQCFKEDQCLWVDTPNCVYSYRYGQKVCCSTFNC
ncbi:unnamed protein product [Haemonchus placei]|uniref:EB domain-containing protein n=1 Tax=Haemonchus placei TaxID=6290 RepID=A0A0N4WVL0_HAEPC|nr:unnamed protein product [Haemonchus placei]